MTDRPASAEGGSPLWRLSPERRNRIALVLLVLLTAPMLTKIFTSDFGTHIAKGRQVVQTRSIPQKEFLNYPSLQNDTDNGEWAFQAILYLVHSAGGEYAVSFFVWLVVVGIFYFTYRATVDRGANPFLVVLCVFAFSGFLRIRIQPRPEIFTYLFTAVTIFLLTEYYYGKRRWTIWLYPALVPVWANCHPTYLMGFLLCGAFFADALLRAAWRKELAWARVREWVLPPLAAGALALVLCGLNPYGYERILAPLAVVSSAVKSQSGVLQSISELTPVKGTGFYSYYVAAAAFAGVSLLLGAVGRRLYLIDLILFVIAFKGAWDSARAVSMMGLFLAPGISLHMTGFLERVRTWTLGREEREAARRAKERARGASSGKGGKRGKPPEPPPAVPAPGVPSLRWLRLAATAALALCAVAFGTTTLVFSASQLEYGVGMTEHKFSFQAAEFLRKNPVPGNMFNFFDIGGFLDWQLYPQALTFLDGRTNNAQVFMEHQQVTSAMPGWDGILRRYGVTYIVTKAMDSSGMILPIISVLANDNEWALVFSDGLFVVFVRRTPELEGYIRRHEIPKGVLPRHIIREAYHYMFLGVSPVVAYSTMSNMYLALGDRRGAAEILRRALESEEVPFLRARLRELEGGPGLPAGPGAR